MKTMDMLEYNLTEGATLARKYTADTEACDGLIIELAVIPDGIEVRGVLTELDKDPSPAAFVLHWATISASGVNQLIPAIECVKNSLMGTE